MLQCGMCLTLVRYAFDIIGAVFFGKQFGFMQNRHDHGKYIESVHLASTYTVLIKLLVFCHCSIQDLTITL